MEGSFGIEQPTYHCAHTEKEMSPIKRNIEFLLLNSLIETLTLYQRYRELLNLLIQ